jgi:hypothetical protein
MLRKDYVPDFNLPATTMAGAIGVTRQAIINVWLVERLQAEAANK